MISFGLLATFVPLNAPSSASPPGSLPPAGPGVSPSRPHEVEYHADLQKRVDGHIDTLTGHVVFQDGTTVFTADRIVYDETTQKGEATRDLAVPGGSIGPPTVYDEFNTLTADRYTFDFSSKDPSKKVVTALGSVRLVAKPKPVGPKAPAAAAGSSPSPNAVSPPPAARSSAGIQENAEPPPAGKNATVSGTDPEKQDRLQKRLKEETVLTCDRLDYYYRSHRAVAEQGIKVVQGERWLTGDQAIYYGRYDTVVINGNVRGEDEKGRTFNADHLKVVLTGETETIEASKLHGAFTIQDDEGSASPDETPTPLPGSDSAAPVSKSVNKQ